MIIRNFDVVRTILAPHKADPPLLINSDAVLSLAVTRQPFEPIARERGECLECVGRVQDTQTLFRLA